MGLSTSEHGFCHYGYPKPEGEIKSQHKLRTQSRLTGPRQLHLSYAWRRHHLHHPPTALNVKLPLSPHPPCRGVPFPQMPCRVPRHCAVPCPPPFPCAAPNFPCSTGLGLSGSPAPESRCCGSEASRADSALGSIGPRGAPGPQAVAVPAVPGGWRAGQAWP